MPSGSNFMSEANKVKGQKLRVSESVNKRKKGNRLGFPLFLLLCYNYSAAGASASAAGASSAAASS